jgi:CDP-glucose 4,6-dehydratase
MESMVDLNYLKSVYQNKKVFVTGHTGFKGSWLVSILHLVGAEIKGYALAPENSNDLYPTIDGDKLCESVISDIRDKPTLTKELLAFQPDFIFHLAAQPLVLRSYEIPCDTFEINVIGTAYLLEAVRSLNKPCSVVLITTDKVYDNKEWHYAYRENDNLGGYDPYSASKAASELIINSYRNSFFNVNAYSKHFKAIASARAGNVIGGGDWARDRIIPDIVRALQNEQSIEVRNPFSVRPWQHVLEPLVGYLLLAAKLAGSPSSYSGAWNFGPSMEDNISVKDIVETAIYIFGKGQYHTPLSSNNVHEAGLLKLDISKAINELNWRPKWTAKQAIEKTLAWYLNDTKTAFSYTQQQILEYL